MPNPAVVIMTKTKHQMTNKFRIQNLNDQNPPMFRIWEFVI